MTPDRWQRIVQIFHAALQLPVSDRKPFVLRECPADPEACHEILAMIEAHDTTGFLDRPALPVLAGRPVFSEQQIVAGRYRILRFVARGGMGEVYEAADLELRGPVALKILLPEIANDQRMIARFKQEIQLSRKIAHPNVCRVFDLARHPADSSLADSVVLYTMEFLEGETLRARLGREQRLAPDKALEILEQIAQGLDAAHRYGVIHRDLKPSNVILAARAVITDFGIAHSLFPDRAGAATMSGEILGTLDYMAPEVLTGGSATVASDIYALALIAYKMVTGSLPFAGETPLAAAILRSKARIPPPRSLAPNLDPAWERALLRGLDPDPLRRFSSAGAFVKALRGDTASLLPAMTRRKWAAATMAAVTLVIGLAAGLRWCGTTRPDERPLALNPFTLDSGVSADPTISEDGRTVAYISDRDTKSGLELYVKSTADQARPRRLTFDGADKSEPCLSPDAQWIAFRSERAGGGIYVIPVSGGDPQLITDGGRTPRFSPDGARIAYWTGDQGQLPHVPGRIFVVGAKGGVPQQLASSFAGGRYPVWTPDGKHILFEGLRDTTLSWDKSSEWDVVDLASGQVLETGAQAALRTLGLTPFAMPSNFRGSSFLGSARGEQAANLYKIDLSPRTWHLARPPQQLTVGTNILWSPWIARSGRMVAASLEATLNIWRIPEHRAANDYRQAVTANDFLNAAPSVSRDGRLLTFSKSLGRMRDIWMRDLNKPPGSETQLFASPQEKYAIILRPDGKEVAFSMNEGGRHAIYILNLSTAERIKLCSACGDPTGWSPSMENLLVTNGSPSRIELRPRSGGESRVLLQRTDYALGEAQFSPDGSWIVFRAGLGGDRLRLFVAPYRPTSFVPPQEWIPITEGKFWEDKPRWSTDGNAIYFQSMRDNFMCLWMQKLDPHSKDPIAHPSALMHFHSQQFALSPVASEKSNLSVGGGYLFFNAADMQANIWIGRLGPNESSQQ
jgi:eukaryotic-like serine/threonine-protein kinase